MRIPCHSLVTSLNTLRRRQIVSNYENKQKRINTNDRKLKNTTKPKIYMSALSTGFCQLSLCRNNDNFLLLSYLSNTQTCHVMGTKFAQVSFLRFYFQVKSYHFLSTSRLIRTHVQSANKSIDFLAETYQTITVYHGTTETKTEIYVFWDWAEELDSFPSVISSSGDS